MFRFSFVFRTRFLILDVVLCCYTAVHPHDLLSFFMFVFIWMFPFYIQVVSRIMCILMLSFLLVFCRMDDDECTADGSFSTRFSATRLRQVADSQSKNKKEVISKGSFGSLLNVSAFSVPPNLLDWVVMKIDPEKGVFRYANTTKCFFAPFLCFFSVFLCFLSCNLILCSYISCCIYCLQLQKEVYIVHERHGANFF